METEMIKKSQNSSAPSSDSRHIQVSFPCPIHLPCSLRPLDQVKLQPCLPTFRDLGLLKHTELEVWKQTVVGSRKLGHLHSVIVKLRKSARGLSKSNVPLSNTTRRQSTALLMVPWTWPLWLEEVRASPQPVTLFICS